MSRVAVRVERVRAEEAIENLRAGGYLNEDMMILQRGSHVEIPVLSSNLEGEWEVVRQHRPSFKRPRLSHGLIKRSLGVEGDVARALKHWELLGSVLLVNLPDGTRNKEEIGTGLMRLMPRVKAVLNCRSVQGVYRQPEVELIAGGATETIHRENGCIFKLDPMKVMFSSGNQWERRRMARISNPSEIVLDMFAGIGQFTIPLAKYSRPRKVYAVEKNPTAYSYLSENVKLNGLANVVAIHGDCREVSPRGVADRAIMGYFNARSFLPTALDALRGCGVIHHHILVKKDRLVEEAEGLVADIDNLGYSARIMELKRVKSYAPSLYHYVVDISIAPR
ncbi:MAG: class I SAM-dependent methyltransferase family protein [Candidatus Hydrothermarchaeaceae archaeon]